MTEKLSKVLVIAGVTLGGYLNANAVNTSVQDLWGAKPNIFNFSAEWNLYNSGVGSGVGNGVMEYLYGAGHFTRVSDGTDNLWTGSPGHVVFTPIYYNGDTDGIYTTTPSGTPSGSAIVSGGPGGTPSRTGSATSFTPASQPFLFAVKDQNNGEIFYSDPTRNTADGGMDHMVTFAVTGYLRDPGNASSFTSFTDGSTHYVLGFEDGSDFDFNDVIMEVSGVTPDPPATPDGGSTIALLGAAIVAIGSLRRKLS